MAPKRLWFRFTILSEEWSVYLVDPTEHTDLQSREGICVFEIASIYIAANLAPTRLAPVVFHEMLHAWTYLIGIQKALKFDDEQEELLTSMLAPVVFDSLVRSQLLSLPPLPRE